MEILDKEIKRALFDQSKKADSLYVNLMDIPELGSDQVSVRLVKKYRNFHTINRNLRLAFQFVENAIGHREARSNQLSELKERDLVFTLAPDDSSFAMELHYIKAGVLFAIVVYARWFLSTEGKTRLNPKDFFSIGSQEEKWHDFIMQVRSKYIAHNELDLFSEDDAYIEKDKDGNLKIFSRFFENIGMEKYGAFSLEQLRDCIRIVHDTNLKKIDELEKEIGERIIKLGISFSGLGF